MAENWLADQVPLEELKEAVLHFLRAGQYERPQVLADLVDLSRRGTKSLAGIKSSLELIVNSGVHGRTSAAIQFLQHLGATSVKQVMKSEPMGGRLGYAVVRSLGKLRERESVLHFWQSGDETIREAVVEALDDIGDSASLLALQNISAQDQSEFIRGLAVQLLRDR